MTLKLYIHPIYNVEVDRVIPHEIYIEGDARGQNYKVTCDISLCYIDCYMWVLLQIVSCTTIVSF